MITVFVLSLLAIVPLATPCDNLTPAQHQKWAIEQNDAAYEAAAARRDGASVVGVRTERTTLGRSAGLFSGGFNNVTVRETTISFPGAAPYGGGPVLLVNPFIPPAAK